MVTPPTAFEVSIDDVSFGNAATVGTAGNFALPVYIRLAATTPVGNYSGNISLSSTGISGFTVAMPNSTVNPAPLTIKADDKSKIYDAVNPALTLSYNGFVNNEGPAQLTALPLINTTAIITSTVGEYPITVSGAASPNYTFIYIPGILTVLPKSIGIPNTFTPNGDGINDVWNIQSLTYFPLCTVNIYNRYGSLVYQSKGYDKPWDGMYNGTIMPVGTYYYVINLQNGTAALAGYVTVVR